MAKFIAKFDGKEVTFSSKTRTYSHVIVTHGLRCDGQTLESGVMYKVGRPELVDVMVKKAGKVFKPENVRVFEVQEVPALVTAKFKRGIDSLLGLR